MKKMNKKGFTLAELLIVIAIIAILIAIAIPAFGGALENAKLQADHANIRSAYAMYQSAKIGGTLYLDDTNKAGTSSADYYFQPDGKLSTNSGSAYKLKADAGTGDCAASVGCGDGTNHKKDNKIHIGWNGKEVTAFDLVS